jgi:uncharacterized protein (UPF0276 family)
MRQAIGIGLRKEHYQDFFTSEGKSIKYPSIDCLEIITENYFRTDGLPFQKVLKLREDYSLSSHGVSLSLASLGDLDYTYLNDLKKFYDVLEPMQVSDHLCFTGLGHSNTHNLLPFLYNKENLELLANRIDEIQTFLQRPMIFENLSMYLNFKDSTYSESEFMAELHQKTGVKFLLDINNIIVNKKNFQLNPLDYIQQLPAVAVAELHLAGHSNLKTTQGEFAFDTHSTLVDDETWDLYKIATVKFSSAFTILERDENIPSLQELIDEVTIARQVTENHP